MKTISGIEFASEHNGTDVFRVIELAYEQGRKDGHSEQLGTNLAEAGTNLISRAAAQTELQLSARRYTVAHEAHGEGRVVWSEDLISVSDAMDVLRKIPPAQPTFDARDTQYNLPIGTDCISRRQAIDAVKRLSLGETDATRLAMRIEDYLERLPSAQPKKGKWIYHIDDLFPAESTMECNQCHAEQPLTCDDEFCPHCGAKMEVTNE